MKDHSLRTGQSDGAGSRGSPTTVALAGIAVLGLVLITRRGKRKLVAQSV